jgi:uncharacterized membrane protein
VRAKELFIDKVKAEVEAAISQAELQTSGEIRIFVEDHCKDDDVLDRAAYLFAELEIHKTDLRNGVLFYMAVKDHRFAILGDGGINEKVPDKFWDHIKDHMVAKFKEGEIPSGLKEGILMAGEALKSHFPLQDNDENELSNEVVIG